MLDLIKIFKTNKLNTLDELNRTLEPNMTMEQAHQALQYNEANKWGGVMDGVHTYHLCHLARLIQPHDTVIDLCCGTANLLIKAAEIFTETTFIGIDLSKAMLDIAQLEVKQKNLKN